MEGWLPIIGVLALIFGVVELARIHARLAETEARLTRLLAHLGIDPDAVPEPSETVKELARAPGSKIPAIRAYRQQTGLGLREAKAVIDRLSV